MIVARLLALPQYIFTPTSTDAVQSLIGGFQLDWRVMLRLCACITHILTCYKPSAYRSRHVPYLLPDSAFMGTTGPFLPDYTARMPPSVTILVLN